MKSSRVITLLAALATLALCAVVAGTDAPIQIRPESIVWTAGPPTLPPGARSAILEGDPRSDGMFTLRVSFPPNYRIPLHTHGQDERVTVLSGVIYVGIGETVDLVKETAFEAGSFYVTPTKVPHWIHTGTEGAVLQATGLGPWSVDYVNAADDPRNRTKGKE